LSPADKEKLDMQARAQQMKINTRLTALQTALSIMQTTAYSAGVEGSVRVDDKGEKLVTPRPVWIHRPGPVDHLTLLAMATDIEKYILGEIEQETKDALDALNKPKPTIVPAKDMPASNLR
jgi:hypothetical protein